MSDKPKTPTKDKGDEKKKSSKDTPPSSPKVKEEKKAKDSPRTPDPTPPNSSRSDKSAAAAAATEDSDSEDSSDSDLEITDTSAASATSASDSPPPKKLSWLQKKKKGLAGKAATSALGKSLLDKYLDSDVKLLLQSIKAEPKESGSKKASQVNNDIIKVAVKLIFLHDQKRITDDSFNGLTFAFRRLCSALRNAYQKRSLDQSTAERINGLCLQFSTGITDVVKPFVTKKTVDKITGVITYLGDPAFLLKVSKQKEFEQIAYVLASFLQS